MVMAYFRRQIFTAFLLVLASTLGGCGFGDVQFEGKVFDLVGINNLGKTGPEPKLQERAPIVMPPASELPEPGKRKVTEQKDMLWPEDPDQKVKTQKQVADAKIRAYCEGPARNEYDPDYNAELASKCPSLLSNMLKNVINN